MNADSVFAMLNEANPVPDPARYQQMTIDGHTFLAATKERTLHMETITPTPEMQEPPTRRRGLAIAFAVFVVVLVGVAALTLIPRKDVATIPAPPFNTSADGAEAYLTAYFTGTYEQMDSLMGVDGRNDSQMFHLGGDFERMEMRFAWLQASLGPYRDLECAEPVSEIVECTYMTELLDLTRQGIDGTIMYTQYFKLDSDGLLAWVGVEKPAFTDQHRATSEAFEMWLSERYPELDAEYEAFVGTGAVTRTVTEMRTDWVNAIDEYLVENG